jgi:hypothetical protein
MMWRAAARLAPRPLRLAASRVLAAADSRRLERQLAVLASGNGPIVAGPWLGEVGFELLYWAPFLAWFQQRFAVEPSRLIVISRGGTGRWYPTGVRYADVLDEIPAEAFRAEHQRRVEATGEQKQLRETAFEQALVRKIAARLDAGGAPLLHPSTMYAVLRSFWWGHTGADWVHRHVRYRTLVASPACGLPPLPDGYTAVKFYFNDCFPPSPHTADAVRSILASLVAEGPVVLLSSGVQLDDHGACHVDGLTVVQAPLAATPARNLEMQSAIAAGARRFVGTYGGFAYLAPFHGVPSTAYYADASGFATSHLRMAHSALERIGGGGLLETRPLTGNL